MSTAGMNNNGVDLEMEIMRYVIRDPDTDEITGISEDAPDHIKAAFVEYMQALEDLEPIVR